MKRRILPALGALLVPAVAFAGALLAGTGANAATSNGGYRIMPLGDSITYGFGSSGGGYRPTLWQKLTGAGATVDFVGSQSSGGSGLGDADHEGHSGWTTQQIYDNITSWQSSYKPQTILLHIGTNDITNNNWSGAANLLGSLVDRIVSNNPSVNLFIAKIIPISYSSGDQAAQQFNATIPNMVASRVAKGAKIYVVDMHSALSTSDLGDQVHPNNNGYAKMGNAWWTALQEHPEAYGKSSTTTTSTTTTTTTTTSQPPQQGVVLSSTFEGGTDSWAGRGAASVAASGSGRSGSALSVTGRTDTWNGAIRDVTSTLRTGQTYYIEAWARMASGASSESLNLAVERVSSGTTAYDHPGEAVSVSSGEWVRLSGSYTVPSDATGLQLYVEGNSTGSFLLDDVTVSTEPITTTTTTEPTTTEPSTTKTTKTTKSSTTKTTKTFKTKLIKKCKTSKNGQKVCRTITRTVKG